ncbi:MAG: glycosyltransferase, partial [Candidatus Lokiarchaeota archaeon]|nr:glycosyltransferase [Candidatus Lokiarchaeota archaeon]
LKIKPTVSIILPALNEEEAIRKVINEIPLSKMPPTEILVVDGCSDDRTRQIARDCDAKVITERENGYGKAINTGIENAKGDIVVWMDSDYTYPSYQIPNLIKPIMMGQADIVLGSRIKGNIQPGAMKPLHRFGNLYLTMMYNILFFRRLTDTQTGLRAFSRKAMESLKVKSKGMSFATQTLCQAAKKRLKIKEIKIEYKPRIGCSKLHSFKDGTRIFVEILKGIFR